MKDKEKTRLLRRAMNIAENISDQLDRAYIAHCKATGIQPDRAKHDAEYGKKRV